MVFVKFFLRLLTFLLYKSCLASVIDRQARSRYNKKVLVQMNSGIGDSILALPLIHELKRKGYEIHALSNQNTNTIGELCPDIRRSYILEYKISNFFKILKVQSLLKKINFRYFIGVLPSNQIRDFFLPLLLKIPVRIKHITPHPERYRNYDFLFSKLINVDSQKNNVESNLMLLSLLNEDIGANERELNIFLPENLIEIVKEKLIKKGYYENKTAVGIHPGCKETWSFKRWPAKKFAELIDHLTQQSSLQVLLFGGSDERDLIETILQDIKIRPMNLIGEFTLKESICGISFCDIFISNDSGLMHIATTFGIPVIGLFGGRSNEVLVGPYGAQHTVIKNNDIRSITVEEVIKATNKLLINKKARRQQPISFV